MVQVVLCAYTWLPHPTGLQMWSCQLNLQIYQLAIQQIYAALNPEHAVALAQASSITPHICVDTEETGGHKKLGYICIKLESQLHMYKLSCSDKTKMEFRTSSRMSAQQDDLVLLFECICSSFIYWTRPHLPMLCHISIFLWTQTKEEGGQEGHICHA